MFAEIKSKDELKKLGRLNHLTIWGSRFNFLRSHSGIRPARLCGLMGTTGSGKSSLLKAIIPDTLKDCIDEYQCLLWLTEEKPNRYASGLLFNDPEISFKHLKIFHEDKIPEEIRGNLDQLIAFFKEVIIESKARVVFLDNITTSKLYSSYFGERGQAKLIEHLKEFCYEFKITVFFLVHTNKNINDSLNRLMVGEDVRGSNQAFMACDYFYILQRFNLNNERFTFIQTVKHRDHELKHTVFKLKYDYGKYIGDTVIDFNSLNEHFKNRNFLGKR